jgi:SsrA-binding protein
MALCCPCIGGSRQLRWGVRQDVEERVSLEQVAVGIKVIANNRKAFHEYIISEKVEAGIALTGTEVKSARDGKVNLTDGWVEIDENGEAFLHDAHIGKYSHGSYMNHEEKRSRKLLLNRKELIRLAERTQEKGFTIVALQMYFKDQYIKVEIGVGKGKKLHDKRDSAKAKEDNRAMARAMRSKG